MEPESRKGAREFQVDDDMAGEVAVLRDNDEVQGTTQRPHVAAETQLGR